MTHPAPPRKTSYVGCLGYNDSPEDLGEPSGFWQFENDRRLWQAFEVSESLNHAFDMLGEPTYSRIVLATDDDGYILFHLLILSVKFISIARETEAIELAKAWLIEQGVDWNTPDGNQEEFLPPTELPF